jgi:hypothetical protein
MHPEMMVDNPIGLAGTCGSAESADQFSAGKARLFGWQSSAGGSGGPAPTQTPPADKGKFIADMLRGFEGPSSPLRPTMAPATIEPAVEFGMLRLDAPAGSRERRAPAARAAAGADGAARSPNWLAWRLWGRLWGRR